MAGLVLCLTAICPTTVSFAQTNPSPQRPRYDKLSPMLRKLARQSQRPQWSQRSQSPYKPQRPQSVCAFVKVADGGEAILQQRGCRVLAQMGDICIADIPKSAIGPLSLDRRILRIEANRNTHALTDSVALHINATPIYAGQGLPQAYTGRGVVMGVMDIGFDLTHPTFYSRDTTEYRIRRFWDMLSADTLGSNLYVGRDYTGREELLTVAHARDGLDETHGTHTLGIAAGSGYDSPYRGLAPESDICIVANAVTQDTVFIDPEDYDKYTFATDALGFKYIFDYAESQGKPCVINFSEGSGQDFWGYDQLYYEMLQRLTGPGRIIVSAAGNNGNDKTWFRKEQGIPSAGSFVRSYERTAMVTFKSLSHFDMRIVAYGNTANDTLTINTADVLQQADSVFAARLYANNDSVEVLVEAYPSCYVPEETCYDLTLTGKKSVGGSPCVSFEVVGIDADVETFRVQGSLTENQLNPSLNAGEKSHSVLSPGSAPNVICVGATFYRDGVINYEGKWKAYRNGPSGERQTHSAMGPTFDGRVKPDVMAPGLHIISSYSSYYLESHPNAGDISWDVAHFDFNGRTYAWNCNSGTSMASPAVAGVIALWLQACPTLSPEDILGVLERTARHYDPELTYPNNKYGHGEIDAYRGLLDILGADKITGVSATPANARFTFSNGMLDVQLPSTASTPATISVYSLSGLLLARHSMPAGTNSCHLPVASLRKGDVCVVQIDGDTTFSGSMLVRRP